MRIKYFIFFVSFMCTIVSCSKKEASRSENVLGTVCTISLFESASEGLYNEIFLRLRELDGVFNVNREDSEVSLINASSGVAPVAVGEDAFFVIKESLRFASFSEGLFDPTIGPLVRLWGINTENARVPSKKEIEDAKSLVGWHLVSLKENSGGNGGEVFLPVKGMSLDFGGIAKGYACDEVAGILKKHRVKRAIIDLGGNIYVYGRKKDGTLWNVGIKDPFNPNGEPLYVLSVDGGMSVVTSGVYERFFIKDNIRYHHILDPRTGNPSLSECVSCTIIAPSSVLSDAMSTIYFMKGYEDNMAEDVQAVFVLKDGTTYATGGLKDKIRAYSAEAGTKAEDIVFLP